MKDKMPMLLQNQKAASPLLKPTQCSTFAFAPTHRATTDTVGKNNNHKKTKFDN